MIFTDDLISVIKTFMKKEKINLLVSKDVNSDFWLDDKDKLITIRFRIDSSNLEITYDVYSPKLMVHFKEETIRDVEKNEYLVEENREWNMVEIIENIWLILDEIRLWAMRNNYSIKEENLI